MTAWHNRRTCVWRRAAEPLIARRHLSDDLYLDALSEYITRSRRSSLINDSQPADWAMESHALAKRALLSAQGVIDEAYYRSQISVVDERLALGGLRLAAVLNRSLDEPPPW